MRRYVLPTIVLLAVLVAAGLAWVAQNPTGIGWLDREAATRLASLQALWDRVPPVDLDPVTLQRRLMQAGGGFLAAALLLKVVRPVQRLRRWIRARRAGRVTVRHFVGRSWWNAGTDPLDAAVYADTHSVQWQAEIDAPDWKDVQPPDLLLHLVPPDGSTRVELIARAHPVARHRFAADFAVSDLTPLRSHVGEWTATLLLQQPGEQRVLANQPLPVFDEQSLLADLQCADLGISTSGGSVPEPTGLLLCEPREAILVDALVRTTRCDARALPPLQARLSLARTDGTDPTYVNVPLSFTRNAATISQASLAFPTANGQRPAGRWMLRLIIGDRVLAEQKLGVATRGQMSQELQLNAIHVVGLDNAGGSAHRVGATLVRSAAASSGSVVIAARLRTAAPTPHLSYTVGFAILNGHHVLLRGEQEVVFVDWEQDVIAGEWTPPRDLPDGLELSIVVMVDGDVRGERVLQVMNHQLRITDAQGQIVRPGGVPTHVIDAEADLLLATAQPRPL